MEEIWMDIKDYEGLYVISNYGRVKNNKGIIKKPQKNRNGYLYIDLWKDNKGKKILLHRLVANHFLLNPDNYPEVNHKDENKLNNCVDNLEWCDHTYNNNYGTKKERLRKSLLNNPSSKPVVQYDLNGKEVSRFPSVQEAGRILNLTKGQMNCIYLCCNHKLQTSCGFIWKYAEDC